MKNHLLQLVAGAALIAGAYGQALPSGTILPETLIFSEGDPSPSGDGLENLRLNNFRQYEGQVLMVVYHASW